MQLTIEPDSALDARAGAELSKVYGLEPESQRGDRFAGFMRDDWHNDHFIDWFAPLPIGAPEITDLLFIRNLRQTESSLNLGRKQSHLERIRRRDHSTGAIEEAIKARAERVGHPFRQRVVRGIHHIAQFVF